MTNNERWQLVGAITIAAQSNSDAMLALLATLELSAS